VCVCVCVCVCGRERERQRYREKECLLLSVYVRVCARQYVSVDVCMRKREYVLAIECVHVCKCMPVCFH